MASYGGRLDQLIVTKLDAETKALLAKQAEQDQSSLSVVTRRAIRAYLGLPVTPTNNEVHHGA